LGLLLLTRRLLGRPVIWVRRLSLIRRHQRDGGERFLARLLQVLAVAMEAEELPALVGADGGVRGVGGDDGPRGVGAPGGVRRAGADD
jgi:hypothetical protein